MDSYCGVSVDGYILHSRVIITVCITGFPSLSLVLDRKREMSLGISGLVYYELSLSDL
jgi:hypothetical protein